MSMRLKKKPKIIIGVSLSILFLGTLAFSFPKFFKEGEYPAQKEEEFTPEIEIPKLQILDLDSNTRPVAVMINNHNTARKYHAGLQDAYIVYEMIVEGGITRMMALYKDASTAKIGSIRSSRHYYLDYALENDAIYVHWGYSEYAMNDIKKLGVNNVNGLVDGKYFWKDTKLNAATEHTGFSSMALINQAIDKFGYRKTTNEKPLLNYSIDSINLSEIEGVIPANQVLIKYSGSASTSYEYDIENKNYKRSVNGAPHNDYEGGFQYTAKNIITYQVKNSTISGDIKGRQDLNNVGSGEGYYISEGYAVPITWSKTARTGKTIYKLKNGEDLVVNDGNTYIQIQPVGQTLTIS